jgi:prepilin-type N-terminal cleavage/methylation domain-containing protein
MKVWAQKQKGFTIVELLVVIVVIAILASISVVAYNGIQQRARDSARDSAVRSLKLALEVYKSDFGKYPDPTLNPNGGYLITKLTSSLVPTYISKIPDDPDVTKHLNYVVSTAYDGYGILVPYEGRAKCKYLVGTGATTGWWNDSTTTVPVCP